MFGNTFLQSTTRKETSVVIAIDYVAAFLRTMEKDLLQA